VSETWNVSCLLHVSRFIEPIVPKIHLKPVEDQVVVLMGASSGIGREAARRFGIHGAKVVVSARKQAALDSLAEEIRREGGEAAAVAAEVTDFSQVRRVAETAVERYGRLDTWVHLAGVGLWSLFEETRPEEWQRVIDVNLTGQAYGAMAALPHLRHEGRGALIHVSSIEAYLALPYQAAYSASKHGLHGFLKSLRLELAHAGVPISVTEIMPSGTSTPIFDQARTRLGVRPKPPQPIYRPAVATDAILYAAAHPVREMILGGIAQAGALTQRLAPRLMDAYLLWTSFRTQRSREPKGDFAPANLFEPVASSNRVDGTLAPQARHWSLAAWLSMHPLLRAALAAALLGSILAARGNSSRRRSP
jgi:NAD(P)-dependent dehydrogenase (short-subunit alcohol dehydrogenase family)